MATKHPTKHHKIPTELLTGDYLGMPFLAIWDSAYAWARNHGLDFDAACDHADGITRKVAE